MEMIPKPRRTPEDGPPVSVVVGRCSAYDRQSRMDGATPWQRDGAEQGVPATLYTINTDSPAGASQPRS